MNIDGTLRNIRAETVPDLLAARAAAIALRRQRSDLYYTATDLIKNIELQLKNPDDPDLKAAFKRMANRIEQTIDLNLP